MIGSFFKELPPNKPDEKKSSKGRERKSNPDSSGDTWLECLSVVKRIVRRKSFSNWQADAADVEQTVAVRLLDWRGKNREKSEEMSPEDWEAFAARTTYNEINRRNSENSAKKDISLEDVREDAALRLIEGQSRAEFRSLVRAVWQEICSMTVRQRRSLLLHNKKLLLKLMYGGITDREIADSLEIPFEMWRELEDELPLRTREIAELILKLESDRGKKKIKNLESLTGSIKKARFEAREKVRKVTER